MSTDKFRALRDGDSLDFWGLKDPKCPHCGDDLSVVDQEWWHLYEEGEHEVECPHCCEEFTVSTRVSYSFSTDTLYDTEEDDEE